MLEHLWAPWRSDYVAGVDKDSTPACLFCSVLESPKDRDNLVLHRSDHAFVMLNAYPYTSGHIMVAPNKHGNEICALTDDETLDVHRLVKLACGWVEQVFHPDGFNLGANIGRAAGAGIPQHLHWHVVPRWSGDTNFMSTTGGVRVIPQDLHKTWDLLRSVIA